MQRLGNHKHDENEGWRTGTQDMTCFSLQTSAEFWRCPGQVWLRNEAKCYLEKLSGGVGSLSRLRQDASGCSLGTVETKAGGENLVKLLGYNAEELSCMLETATVLKSTDALAQFPNSFNLWVWGVRPGWSTLILSIWWGKDTPLKKRPSQLKHLRCLMHRPWFQSFNHYKWNFKSLGIPRDRAIRC